MLPESRQKEEKQDLAFLLMQKLFSMSLFLIKQMLSCLSILLKAARSMLSSHLFFFFYVGHSPGLLPSSVGRAGQELEPTVELQPVADPCE